MTQDRPNPPAGKPLDEGQLLDWIDGRLSPAEQAALEASSGRAGLRARVAQMQANAKALRSLGEERAPTELKGRVLAGLEREMLIGLERSAPVSESLPISFTDHVAAGGWSRRWTRSAPALALAAGLALLVGGGLYWSVLLFKGSPNRPNSDSNRLAIADNPNEPATTSISESTAALAAKSAEPSIDVSIPMIAATEVRPGIEHASMTSERVLALAGERRLALRVRAGDTKALRQIEAAGAGKSGKPWRLSKTLPPEVTAALATPAEDRALAMAYASDPSALIAPLLGPNAAFSLPAANDPLRHVKGAYVLDVPADAGSIDDVRSMLAERLHGEAELTELPEPVMLVAAAPEAVLWWTQPPTHWTPRVAVPVIVELR
ncbi:hypothetical protein PHYC_03787 [Phycisphaerales bacterium]|nr:hypothetical protein PHYC_03787 [Phycisphaerales bacterium]